mmetsp:Transcript_29137/g.85424  ORF Transcript_29137/g.85424 Transcript_29137/m.85424 type:complete len:221 (+) Transcript_29137:287-949(+)
MVDRMRYSCTPKILMSAARRWRSAKERLGSGCAASRSSGGRGSGRFTSLRSMSCSPRGLLPTCGLKVFPDSLAMSLSTSRCSARSRMMRSRTASRLDTRSRVGSSLEKAGVKGSSFALCSSWRLCSAARSFIVCRDTRTRASSRRFAASVDLNNVDSDAEAPSLRFRGAGGRKAWSPIGGGTSAAASCAAECQGLKEAGMSFDARTKCLSGPFSPRTVTS